MGADADVDATAFAGMGAGVSLEEFLLRLDWAFSCRTAALRPRRVYGRFAIPISCECWLLSSIVAN